MTIQFKDLCSLQFSGLSIYDVYTFDKAQLLQLNRTQFPSLGIFVSKMLEIKKTKTTFIMSVLKVVY